MSISQNSRRFRVGLDFDNTIVKTRRSAIKIAAKEIGLKIDYTKPRSYSFDEYPEDMKKIIFEKFDDCDFSTDLTILPGARCKLKEWKEAGHKLFIITARNEPIRKATTAYIEKHLPMIDETHFVDMGTSKAEKQKELRLDFWIDDSPIDVPVAFGLGIKTMLISNSDTLYNQYLKSTPGKYTAVYDKIANINLL